MKKSAICLLILIPSFSFAQLGIKGGVNFANITKASSINASSRTGFLAGVFLAPQGKSVVGFRTELIFSRQGYNFKTSTNTGNVNLDYILLPQLTTISITKYFQIQVGAQMAFLINAKADSTANTNNPGSPYAKLADYYNRFDYGLAGGIEVHPVKGLLIGARYNLSLGNLYNTDQIANGGQPSFIPKVNGKNNVFQLFAGWRFGKS